MAEKPQEYDVSVVIPTFRRLQQVEKTIESVARQVNAEGVSYEIIVVDNSPEKSAAETVDTLAARYAMPVRYVSEPRQNIALARNAGINQSQGEFIAMIDDDEWASSTWLDHLVTTIRTYEADVVMGPTIPVYEREPPLWLHGCEMFDRRRDIPTGTVIDYGPSSNFIMRTATCVADDNRFDPEVGRTGGSDTDFFMRLGRAMKRKIVWCNEAVVEEGIPAQRLTLGYLLRRELRSNQIFVRSSVKYSDHPMRTAAYLTLVVGMAQIAIWSIPSLISAPFQTAYSFRAKRRLMKGLGKLFWGKMFRFISY